MLGNCLAVPVTYTLEAARLLHYSRWAGVPVTSLVHLPDQSETRLASFLLSLGCSKTDTQRLRKTLGVSVLPGINPTRTSLGLLLNYDCHFLSPLCSPLRLYLPLPRSYGPSSFNAVLSC